MKALSSFHIKTLTNHLDAFFLGLYAQGYHRFWRVLFVKSVYTDGDVGPWTLYWLGGDYRKTWYEFVSGALG